MSVTAAQEAGQQGGRDATWHGLTADEACIRFEVDPRSGLDTAEVERRRAEVGPNKLEEAKKEPAWQAFLRQYRDLMQLVLLGAAIVSIVALQEWSTGLVIIGLTVLNAVLGLNQEGKAAESVAALQKMLLIHAHVRRGGQRVDIPAEEVVPGDIVTFEAGDKVPADGRLILAATLEIEEAALTGESTPVLKSVDPVSGEDVPLGDRIDMAYMNSTVTRGRGEMVVTATGMNTEVGQISRMLSQVEQEKTPLTRQLDQLTVLITIMAAAALALVVIFGLLHGDDFDDLFVIGIALAIAAIPTGLPAVVTTMLSLGTQALAAKGAIVKRLRSVETLGSTSAICSDKTGTLTLNQMTARELIVVGRRYSVEGEGYSTAGKILRIAGEPETSLDPFLLPMALANDAAVHDGEIVGDPTEAALVVLAAKGGLDVDEERRLFPRVGEVPFDSEYKFMATFHEMEDNGRKVVRCFIKGAPDVLLARSSQIRDADGSNVPAAGALDRVLAENDRLAGEGLRVLAVATRDIDPSNFDAGGDLLAEVQDVTLLALVGIVDPPRKEARDAIALCKDAGIQVRMITGDHATTAAAIAGQLGIEGRALTGTEFAALSGIYDNLMKYVRIQLIELGAFILLFVLAGAFDVANGAPLTPLQVLWINFAIDVVLAIGLGFDAAVPGLMKRRPRDASAPIVNRPLAIRLGSLGLVMAVIALGVVAWGEDRYDLAIATTMGLTTLSLMHIVAALEVREPTLTVFSRYTLENRRFVKLIGVTLVLTFLVTELNFLQRIFDTVSLTSSQWGICLLGPIVYLAIAETVKLFDRRSHRGIVPAGAG